MPRLFVRYAVASLVPVIALGAVLLWSYHQEAQHRALGQGRAQADVIEEMAIAPALSGVDLSRGLSRTADQRLLAATQLATFSNDVLRLRVRSFDGQVRFSDDGVLKDPLPASSPEFRAAAAGRTSVAIVGLSGFGQTIRVLEPIMPNTDGQATGVLEVYLPYAPIAAAIRGELHDAYALVALALLGLYLVLALISWSTTRQLRRHAAEREHQSLHDPLTGLPNRRHFTDSAERIVHEATVTGRSAALCIVDLNGFKQVNDQLGHQAGDELLKVVARSLGEALRTDDFVARLGGDEFGILLPGIGDTEQAVKLLEAVSGQVAQEIDLNGTPIQVTGSFGLALVPDDASTVEELIRISDTAMYDAKRTTRGVKAPPAGLATDAPPLNPAVA